MSPKMITFTAIGGAHVDRRGKTDSHPVMGASNPGRFTQDLGGTHLVELLISMATVAYQTAYSSRSQTGKQKTAVTPRPGKRPALLNSCHAYREDGPIVARQFPDFYTGFEQN